MPTRWPDSSKTAESRPSKHPETRHVAVVSAWATCRPTGGDTREKTTISSVSASRAAATLATLCVLMLEQGSPQEGVCRQTPGGSAADKRLPIPAAILVQPASVSIVRSFVGLYVDVDVVSLRRLCLRLAFAADSSPVIPAGVTRPCAELRIATRLRRPNRLRSVKVATAVVCACSLTLRCSDVSVLLCR